MAVTKATGDEAAPRAQTELDRLRARRLELLDVVDLITRQRDEMTTRLDNARRLLDETTTAIALITTTGGT